MYPTTQEDRIINIMEPCHVTMRERSVPLMEPFSGQGANTVPQTLIRDAVRGRAQRDEAGMGRVVPIRCMILQSI